MKRKIIHIDEDKCNGCGICLPNCPEGALKIIEDKARLVSDLFCDGLGACIGHCPEGAITILEREAEPYDERRVLANIIPQGEAVIKAHLEHLRDHNEHGYLKEAVTLLKEKGLPVPIEKPPLPCGCPGSAEADFRRGSRPASQLPVAPQSELSHWPIQFHLVSPQAPYFAGADILLAADCVAYALGGFHQDYLKGKRLIIGCPKLDQGQDIYFEKLVSLIDDARINTLTVMTMEVPCCTGLLNLARQAAAKAQRRVPIKSLVVGIQGEIKSETWL